MSAYLARQSGSLEAGAIAARRTSAAARVARAVIETLERRELLTIVRPDHVVIVIEQDRASDSVGSQYMPYLTSLASTGLVYQNSHSVTHPSEPNLLGLFSGSTQGVTTNNQGYSFPTQANIAKSLFDAGFSFTGYSEDLPSDGSQAQWLGTGTWPDQYVRYLNPMAMFSNYGINPATGQARANAVVNRTFAAFKSLPSGDYSALPTVSFIVPNNLHSTHGSNEAAPWAGSDDPANNNQLRSMADTWLHDNLDSYYQWAKTHNSMLIVTGDEEQYTGGSGRSISTIVTGAANLFVAGTNADYINHFSVLRTIEDMYGLAPLGESATTSALRTDALGRLTTSSSALTATAITLTPAVIPSGVNQSVTFVARVTDVSGSAIPTGRVTFSDGTALMGTVYLDALGNATLTSAGLSTGTHKVTAAYAGDPAFWSSAITVNQIVRSSASTVALSTSSPQVQLGQPVTFTATVSPVAPASGIPTGTVTFKDGSTTLGSAALDAQGRATFASSSLTAGSHSVIAVYAGSSTFGGSVSAALNQQVNAPTGDPIATGVTVGSSANPAVVGQAISFTATVAALPPNTGSPGGTLQFILDGSALGSPVSVINGIATSAQISNLSLGTHSIGAVYSGDPTFAGSSSSSTLSQTVNQAATTATATTSANPATVGQAVTLSATVTVTAPGSGLATGTVAFVDGSTVIGTATLDAFGKASITTSTLADGTHPITVVYGGDALFTGSASGVLSQVVQQVVQPPPVAVNDTFASRIAISGATASVTGSNVGASKQTSEPNHAGLAGGASVWWTWTAPATGSVTIDTAGSTFDTLLAVYTGNKVQSLTVRASNNDSAVGVTSSKVTFSATANTAYQIAVDGNAGATGNIVFNLVQVPAAPGVPTAVAASDGTFTDRVRITWTAPARATAYEVWRSATNSSAAATKISVDDVTTTTYDDTTGNPGTTYYYFVKAKNTGGISGFSASNAGFRSAAATAPNNNFASRTVLSGTQLTVTSSNVGATKETGEPSHAANVGGKSLWWSWTAAVSGSVTIDTLGSSFDTLLGVYTGTAVNALTQVAANDDSLAGGTTTSKVTFNAVAGVTYQIAVDGYGGASGSITLILKA